MRGRRHTLLRERTRPVHDDVEAVMAREGFFDSPSRYRDYLERMNTFHLQFASGMTDLCQTLLRPWGILDHGAALTADLEILGVHHEPLSVARKGGAATSTVATPRLPVTATADDVMGTLYVLIGASLGSRILVQRAASLGCGPTSGAGYLAALAADTGWPRFLAHLEQAPAVCETRMVGAAIATFTSILDHVTTSPIMEAPRR